MDRAQRVAVGRLLATATAAVGRPDRVDVGPLLARVPQDRILPAAEFHRVEGCLHEWLRDTAGVDRSILDALGKIRADSVVSHLTSVRAFGPLADCFAAADVPWLVLKGTVLASLLYRDPGLRRSIDVDVLVPRHRFVAAVDALRGAGFRDLVANWPLVCDEGASELTLADDHVSVDVHWHLLYAWYHRRGARVDTAELLERARTVSLGGRQVRTLDPVDTLLHLGLHAAISGADRLIWLKDIERSLAVERPDPDELVRRARATNRAPMVGLSLQRASSTLGFELPDGLASALTGRSLAFLDRLVSTISPPERSDARGSPSRYLARAVGSGPASTAAALGWIAVDRLRSRLSDTDGSRLDHDDPNELTHPAGDERDERRYLRWVAGGAEEPDPATFAVRRVRSVDQLAVALGAHEPRITAGLADVLAFGLRPWGCRAWLLERDDEVAGAVVVRRTSFDRWFATVLVVDPAAAAAVARVVDGSPAWFVTGSALDIRPILPVLRRRRDAMAMPWVVAPPPVAVTTASDDGVRDATRNDLDALVALYRGYELASESTVWQLRGTLRRLLDHQRVLVAEDDGRIIGAIVVSGPTRHWIAVDGLTVLPEHRGRRLGWALVARCQRIANELGIGATGSIAASNPMQFNEIDLDDQWWMGVSLHAPARVRGVGRLRQAYSRVGARAGRDWQVFRDLEDPSRPTRDAGGGR